MLNSKKWLTVIEAANELNLSTSRVRQMIKAKDGTRSTKMHGQKFGNSWAIAAAEVQRVKRCNRAPGNPDFVSKTT